MGVRARGSERQESRARGVHRRAGRTQGRGHGFHQHGRPRNRHSAGRQSRVHRQGVSPQAEQGSRITCKLARLGSAGARRMGRRSTGASKTRWQQDHDEVVELGGLHIVGTERHDSRRIDNQLRGRSGRQGDPGSARVLSVAAGRPDAHLRRPADAEADAAAGHGRRRADRIAR